MALRSKGKRGRSPENEPLVLRAGNGEPMVVFPAELIASHRRMITSMVYQQDLPSRISLLATLRGEGVTYTSVALGTTLASDLPTSVCVVELNWCSPGLITQLTEASQPVDRRGKRAKKSAGSKHKAQSTSEQPEKPGLSDVLTGQASLDEALIASHLPNLSFLPAGNLPHTQRPVIARSTDLKDLIDEIGNRFDHLLLDIPAIFATSDAMALAALAEVGYLVVHQGVTPITTIKQALDDIKHISMRGVILNQVRIQTPRFIYSLIPQE